MQWEREVQMNKHDSPWGEEEEVEIGVDIDADEIELRDEIHAASARVRHGQIKPKTRRAATRIILALDARRERKGLSKAALARDIEKQPAALRRFFREDGNPELYTLLQIADALDAEIVVKPRKKRHRPEPVWDPESWQDNPNLY